MVECKRCGNSLAMRHIAHHDQKTPYCKECLEEFENEMNRRKN